MIQYSEFECPFCGRFARETLPTIRDKYLKPGKAFLAFVHFPLSIHQRAAPAAAVANCAHDEGLFWPLHDRLFQSPKPALDDASLSAQAEALGLSRPALAKCLENGGSQERIQRAVSEARRLQVSSTPTFFFGVVVRSGFLQVKNRMSGALPVQAFEGVLASLEQEVARTSSQGNQK
jgi:protein-disulfide isomerase